MIKCDLYKDGDKFLAVDTETGETYELSTKKTSVKKSSSKVEENNEPVLTLLDNKYVLTTGAIKLLGINIEEDNKLDIKFEKNGKTVRPFIITGSGNKLTKNLTVSCRGSLNADLSKYGNEFKLEPHPVREGVFLLINDSITESEEEQVESQDENLSSLDDLNLDGLDTEEDNNTEFNLNYEL